MGFLHSTGRWRAFPCGFGGQLLPRRLSSGGFTSGLLGTSHYLPADECFFFFFLRGEKNIQGHYLHSIRHCFQTTRSWIPSAPASTVSVVANKCYKPFSGGLISSYRTLINNTARVGGSLPPFSHVTSPERTE